MKRVITAVTFLIAACKEEPPPIATGKCRVMSYAGAKPFVRECIYEGYAWTCSGGSCVRGAEARGEAPIAPGPLP